MSIILHHAPTSGWELPLPGPPVCEWKSDPMSRIEYICQGPCHRACLAAWLEERVSERIELPRESLISCGSGWVNYYLHWVSWTEKHNLEVALGPDSDDLGPDSDDFEMEDTQMLVDERQPAHLDNLAVWKRIFEYLPTSDQRELSVTSRRTAFAAQQVLFRCVHLDAFMQVSRFIEALVLNVARGGPKIKLSLCVEHVCIKLLAGRGPMMRTLQSLITVLPLFLNLNSLTVHTDDWAALFKTGLDSSELAVIVPEKMTTFRLLRAPFCENPTDALFMKWFHYFQPLMKVKHVFLMGLHSWQWKKDVDMGDSEVTFIPPPWISTIPSEIRDFQLWSNCHAVTLGPEFEVVRMGSHPLISQVSLKCWRNRIGLLNWKLIYLAARNTM